MHVVCNASPLIYLSKLGRLDLLHALFEKVILPSEVWDEVVVKGKKERPTEASAVENACKKGWVKCISSSQGHRHEELDIGESAVISLAQESKINNVLIDDAAARKVAEGYGLQVRGTLFVIVEAYRKKAINKQQAEGLVFALLLKGFRMAPELYAECLRELSRI